MGNRNTLYRSLHDIGLAAWFGGSAFGVAGLNGAAAEAGDRRTADIVASVGWAKWSPLNTLAMTTHAAGAIGLLASERNRVRTQPGTARTAGVKAAVTVAAGAATVYARLLGKKIEQDAVHRATSVSSATTSPVAPTSTGPTGVPGEADKQIGRAAGAAAESLPVDVDGARRQLQAVQFAVPVLTGTALVLGAQAGEQQRPTEQLREVARRAVGSLAA